MSVEKSRKQGQLKQPTMTDGFYPTNDGKVGNIQKLSDIHLNDIIKRQENLLKKRYIIYCIFLSLTQKVSIGQLFSTSEKKINDC